MPSTDVFALSDLVVEVLHDSGTPEKPAWKVGSGFLIGSNLVLTAAHNVDVSGELLVRFRGSEEYAADVSTLPSGRLAIDPKHDIAVLEIASTGIPPRPYLHFARIDDNPTLETPNIEGCWAIGFPRFQEKSRLDRNKPLRDSARVDGSILMGEGLVEGLLTLSVTRAPRDLDNDDLSQSQWQGMSGALVFAGSHAVGVITEHHVPAGSGSLMITPFNVLDELEDSLAWWRLLGVADSDILPVLPLDIGGPREEPEVQDWLPAPLDFNAFLNEKRKDFVGREWLFKGISDWLDGGNSSALLITGEPGAGKSAVVAELVHKDVGGRVLSCYCCQADTPATLEPKNFVLSLAAMLKTRLDVYNAMLDQPALRQALSETNLAEDPASAFEQGILNPLSDLPEQETHYYILVDALDEALTLGKSPNIVDLLATRLRRLPSWLKIVATTRPEPPVMRQLRALKAQTISTQEPQNLNDVGRYIDLRLSSPGMQKSVAEWSKSRANLRQALLAASEGNFLFVVTALEAVELGHLTFAQVEELPPGLSSLYGQFFERIFSQAGVDYASSKLVLQAIVASQEAPTRQQLAEVTGMDEEEELPRVLGRLSSFLVRRNSGYTLFHRSLLEWLTDWDEGLDLAQAGDYYVSLQSGHRQWADHYWPRYEAGRPWPKLLLHHLPTHLAGARRWDDLSRVLLDWHFLEAKTMGPGTNVFNLTADFTLALTEMPEDYSHRYLIYLLNKILRLDGQFIARYPTTLFQSCWNRGWWHDAPQVAGYFVAEGSGVAPWRRSGEKLYRFMEKWRAEKEQEAPGFLWLRYLRPPFELLTSAQRAVLTGHDDGLRCVAVSPNGQRIVSGGGEGSGLLKLWDAATGAELVSIAFDEARGVYAICYSPDNSCILTGGYDGVLHIYDPDTLEETDRIATESVHITSLAFSADGKHFATGDWDGVIRLWNADTRLQIAAVQGHSGEVSSLAFSTKDGLLLSCSESLSGSNNGVILWQVSEQSLDMVDTYPSKSGVTTVCFTSDSKNVVWGDNSGNIVIYNLDTRNIIHQLQEPHGQPARVVALLPGGDRLLCGAGDVFGKAPITLFDLSSGRAVRDFEGHFFYISDISLFPDGKAFASAGDATVRIWELDSLLNDAKLRVLEPEVKEHLFSPTQPIIFTAFGGNLNFGGGSLYTGGSEIVWVRSLEDGAAIARLEGHKGGVHSLAVTADGRILAVGTGDGVIHLWDTQTWEEKFSICPHEDRVEGLSFSPDGRYLASGGGDGLVRLIDVDQMNLVSSSGIGEVGGSVSYVSFSSDGQRLLAQMDLQARIIRIWDAKTDEIVTDILDKGNPNYHPQFTPDGHFVVRELENMDLAAWDANTGEQVEVTDAHRETIDDVEKPQGKIWYLDKDLVPRSHQGMLVLRSEVPGQSELRLPLLVGGIHRHPSGRIWVNARSTQRWIFTIEGFH